MSRTNTQTAPPDKIRSGIKDRLNLQTVAAAVAVVLALPLVAIVASATTAVSPNWTHTAQTVLPLWTLNTLALCVMVGVGVLALGIPPAWLVARYEFGGRKALEVALVLPLAVPAYISAMALGWLLDGAGPAQSALRALTGARGEVLPSIRSPGGAALVLSFALYPYVYLLSRRAFLAEGGEAFEIARSLGARPLRAFLRVALPLARPAIAAGAALALMETLAEYGALQLLGVNTWTTAVFRSWLSLGDPVLASQLASLLLVAVAVLLLAERAGRGGRSYVFARRVSAARMRALLPGWRGGLATAVCLLPPFFGFALPGLALLRLAAEAAPSPGLLSAVRSSFVLSVLSVCVVVPLVVVAAYGLRRRGEVMRSRAARFASGVVTLGYATPGAVTAVGVVGVFTIFGGGGAVAALGLWGLLYAYAVRFAAPALEVVDAGLAKVRPSLEDAARGLGCGGAETLLRVHLPLLAPSLGTGALIVFVEVMKELPATLLIRPFGYETLAVRAWSLAADERLGEASYPGLLVMLAGLVPVYLLMRSAEPRPRRL